MSKSTNVLYKFLRLLPIYIIITIMLTIAACGTNESVSSTTQSTSNQVPTNVPNTVTTPGSEIVYVSPNKWASFQLTLIAGDTVELQFIAKFRAMSGSQSSFTLSQMYAVEEKPLVTLGVQDQLGELIYQGEEVELDSVTITAETTGLHTFSFINPFTYQGQDVIVDYIINP